MFRTILLLLILAFTTTSVNAKTYIRDYTYIPNELDTKETCQILTINHVKKILLQELGTHIQHKISSKTSSAGSSYALEEVVAITAGFTRVKILKDDYSKHKYYAKLQLEADETNVLKSLNSLVNNEKIKTDILDKYRGLESENDKIKRENEILKERIKLAKSGSIKSEIIKKYNGNIHSMSVNEKLGSAFSFTMLGQHPEALSLYLDIAENSFVSSNFEVSTENAQRALIIAEQNLTIIHKYGIGVSKNLLKSKYWIKKYILHVFSAKSGVIGRDHIDFIDLNLRDSNNTSLQLEVTNILLDISKKDHFITTKAEFHNMLGYIYKHGISVEKNKSKSLYWYNESCSNNDEYACSIISNQALNEHIDRCIDQSFKDRFKWSCEQHISPAYDAVSFGIGDTKTAAIIYSLKELMVFFRDRVNRMIAEYVPDSDIKIIGPDDDDKLSTNLPPNIKLIYKKTVKHESDVSNKVLKNIVENIIISNVLDTCGYKYELEVVRINNQDNYFLNEDTTQCGVEEFYKSIYVSIDILGCEYDESSNRYLCMLGFR